MATRLMRMTIPSLCAAGKKAKERIVEAVAASGFNHHSAFAVNIALDEAITNAIRHGNHLDPKKKVRLRATIKPSQATILIEDEGSGFVRDHVPDPRHLENLEKCSGRGIFLIESYMDKVEWSHGGRRLKMTKYNKDNTPHPS